MSLSIMRMEMVMSTKKFRETSQSTVSDTDEYRWWRRWKTAHDEWGRDLCCMCGKQSIMFGDLV